MNSSVNWLSSPQRRRKTSVIPATCWGRGWRTFSWWPPTHQRESERSCCQSHVNASTYVKSRDSRGSHGLFLFGYVFFRNARMKMCPDAPEHPPVVSGRSGLFWTQKYQRVQDEKVDGEYGLVINGHSLVRRSKVIPNETGELATNSPWASVSVSLSAAATARFVDWLIDQFLFHFDLIKWLFLWAKKKCLKKQLV